MSLMKKILNHNTPIWDKCADTTFVREIQDGTLPLECFKEYMIQDSIYLKNYARICGKAIYHAATLRDIQVYYSMLDFVTDRESLVRLNYLKQFGLTDDDIEHVAPLPENRNYIDFLVEIAELSNEYEILMAVLPCMLSYSYIFQKIAVSPKAKISRYWDFILDYSDAGYAEQCRRLYVYADMKCNNLVGMEKERLCGIFQKASLLELDFWNMAYRRK